MRKFKLLLLLAAGLFLATFAQRALADDTNQVTLTGLMVCGKCKLHLTTECQNVLQVEQSGTNVNYFLVMNQVSTDFHDNICGKDGEKTTVTGTLSVDNGTNIMTPTEIKPLDDNSSK
jgi:hypothetical protein